MSFFKRLIGRETMEEKLQRETDEAVALERKRAEDKGKAEKKALEEKEKADKKALEEKEKADKKAKEAADKLEAQRKKDADEYEKLRIKHGGFLPPPTPTPAPAPAPAVVAPATPAAPMLSHEQQMKADTLAAQQAAAAAPATVNPLAQLAASGAPASSVSGAPNFIPTPASAMTTPALAGINAAPTPAPAAAPISTSAPPVVPTPTVGSAKCIDCNLDAVVFCHECPGAFCAECDPAFHRGGRAQHKRTPLVPVAVTVTPATTLPVHPPAFDWTPAPPTVAVTPATPPTVVTAPTPAPAPVTAVEPVAPQAHVEAAPAPHVDQGHTVPASIMQSINHPPTSDTVVTIEPSQPIAHAEPTSALPTAPIPTVLTPPHADLVVAPLPPVTLQPQPHVEAPSQVVLVHEPLQPLPPLEPLVQPQPPAAQEVVQSFSPVDDPTIPQPLAPYQPPQDPAYEAWLKQQQQLQQQQQEQEQPQQQQQQQQRPVIPPVPLQLVQQQQPQADNTPRNPDGSFNYDARHRHTPRTPRDGAAVTTASSSSSSSSSNAPSRNIGLLADNTDMKQLHPEEIAELRQMFDQYDINGDQHLALDEVSRFLTELEFTYSDAFVQFLIDHIFGLHIHQRESSKVRSIRGQLTFPEFLEFMRVFYWLHDHVCAEIERQFLHAFKKPVDDEIIAILCRLVRFNEHTELDFNELNLRLVEAVNEEAARSAEAKRDPNAYATQPGASPLTQQHLAQQQREDEMRNQEASRMTTQQQAELEELRRQQQKEDDEKLRLKQQREQFRQQAIQQQQQQHQTSQMSLPPVSEYPDASEDIRRQSPLDDQDDDPFAYHGGSPSVPPSHAPQSQPTPVQMRMDLATRLAASLDQSDDEYIKRSWVLLLKHFDREKKGAINVTDIGQAFRAMGLDPSTAQLNDFFVKADLDRGGSIDEKEFKLYYSELYSAYLRKGLELGQLKKIFRQFDEDSDGRVSIAEFRHVVKLICPSDIELSASDVDRLCKLADVNNDGEVEFREFLDLIRMSTTDSPQAPTSPGSHMYGESPEVARHEQMMAFRAARALTRKIIRAHMPSPMEHILAYSHMPSTFRPSMLARYQTREEFFPSSLLNPVLHSSGMHYEQMQMDPLSKTLRQNPLNSRAGTPDINHASYHIELEYASGIPLPDVAHRSDIVARRCRVCVLGGTKPLSNLYMAKAEWDASEEDRWRFQLRFQENDWNSFVFKTTAKECTILFEFTCLVKKQQGQDKVKGELPLVDSSYVEMSCGFATLDLDLTTPLLKETRLERGIMGGNMDQVEMIKDSEILARRSGWKAVTQLFSGPVKSQLSLKISPARLKEERPVNYFRYLPCNLILPWSSVEVVKLFYEILGAFILLPQYQPLQIGKSCQLSIQLFLKHIVDVPDLLQVLAEVWSETRKTIKKLALREHDLGAVCHAPTPNDQQDTSSSFMLDRFRECVMKLYPAVSMAPGMLPPLIVGISDLKRLSLLRVLVHTEDPLRILTNDGMMKVGAVGAGGSSGVTRAPMSLARAASVQNVRADAAAAIAATNAAQYSRTSIGGGSGYSDPTGQLRPDDPYAGNVEFPNIYAPFHTNEVSFDPNSHSESHHEERRSMIEFDAIR